MKNNLGIVLPMGQSRKLLEESGQWSLWQQELIQYRKAFGNVELFEYSYCDWRRFLEAILMPLSHWKRLAGCQVLKAIHLTGAIPCLIARWLYGPKYVLSFGYRYDQFAKLENKWGQWLLVKLLTPIAVKFASAVIVPTEELKRYVTEAGARRVEIMPNGVDTKLFSPRRQSAISNQQSAINLLFVGRLEKQKNLTTLVQSLARIEIFLKKTDDRLLKKGKSGTLIFVGEGSLKGELHRLAKKLGVEVKFLGSISNAYLPRVYHQADIFVLPSLVEGHPKALLEGMSCGVACLASNIPGVNEIIINGKNGLLVEPTTEGILSGLKELVSDVELRRRLGTAARKTILEKFDKKKLMNKEISLLHSHFELVEKSSPDGHRDDLYR